MLAVSTIVKELSLQVCKLILQVVQTHIVNSFID